MPSSNGSLLSLLTPETAVAGVKMTAPVNCKGSIIRIGKESAGHERGLRSLFAVMELISIKISSILLMFRGKKLSLLISKAK